MGRARRKGAAAKLFVIVSDLHAGSSVALCCPGPIPLDDGQEIYPSRVQLWLYQCWRQFWERVEQRREEWNASLGVVLNGDLVDGPEHHGTVQVMSRHPGVEKHVAKQLLEVPRGLGVDHWHVVRGTESHVGKSGAAEESLAEWLGAERDPDTGTHSWWHLRVEEQGRLLDIAHHGRMGQRPWTKPNVVANLAAEIFYEHAARGERPPDLAIRSHLHRWVDTYRAHPVRLIQTPAWQLHTAYTHKVVPDSLADIGGVIVLLRDGVIEVEECLFKPERSSVWRA